MITVIIVDDEKRQQDTILKMLAEHCPDITIAAVCPSVEEGVKKINLLKPQLVFLDVELGPKTGFDLLNEVDEINFEVIFTTSYSKYAVAAFKVSAVDFLLKPFKPADLIMAVEKFKEKMAMKEPFSHLKILMENYNSNTTSRLKIALPTQGGYVFVHIGDIIRCEADDHYTWFYFADASRKLITKNLRDTEDLLSQYNFFRIHSSHLVNMDCIKEYLKGRGEGGTVKMTDDSMIEVSRKRKNEFLNLFKKL